MICVSMTGIDFDECRTLLKEINMAEIRLDLLDFTIDQVRELFALPNQLVATYRPANGDTEKAGKKPISEAERQAVLEAAVEAGATYVDVELEAAPDFKKALADACSRTKCKLIISYHNFDETPSRKKLSAIVSQCFAEGATLAKVACQVNRTSDGARLLSLYDMPHDSQKEIIAIGMGEMGKITRAAAPLVGAPFTYATLEAGMETAPGQLDKIILEKIYQLM
ncbi:MAG: type I 3-dehydroquinate dehydratase [bacterium]|nr:type I 3-dehydroquinate dehydratase [bacterium]